MDMLFTRLAPYLLPAAVIPATSGSQAAMVEYWNPQLDFYFMTSREDEKSLLDNIVDGIISIKRGMFRREVYKIQFFYRGNQMFELKYANRQCFEEVSNAVVTAFNNSKKIVGLEGEEYKHGEDFRKRGL